MRRTMLKRRPAMRARLEGREAWKEVRYGYCAVCGSEGTIIRHHILHEQKLWAAGREDLIYDLRNSLDIGDRDVCACHYDHHRALRNNAYWRIPRPFVPDEAAAFAVEVLGIGPAAVFFDRYYLPEVGEGEELWRP